MNYVMHFCRNSRLSERSKNYCNNGWIDKDLTNVKSYAPDWKYCRECCEKLGIDYDKQTPTSNLAENELKEYERRKALANANAKKIKISNLRP